MAYNSLANYGVCTSWKDADDVEIAARRGDKLDFQRNVYKHVGIADGKGGVYHFSGEPKRKTGAVYRHDRLKDVAGEDKVRINNTEDRRLKPLPPKLIVKRASETVGTGGGTYNLFTNNCEHKATDMRYGEPVSEQISTLEKVGWAVGASALAIGAISGLAYLLSDSKTDDDNDDDDEDD